MLLGDKLPRFRGDLKVAPKADSKGLFEVTDPVANKHFTLYDFELSMARMMDGKRTAQGVIESSTKLAIPVTLDSLEKFVRQLRAYGFVEDGESSGKSSAPASSWEPREEWDPDLREMFRSALVKFRQRRFAEAHEYLEAMLNMDKENKEAREVLAAIAEREANPPAAPASEVMATRANEALAKVKTVPKWAFGAGAGVVLLLVILIPLPRTLSATVSLQAPAGVAVTTPSEVIVKEPASADGKWVEAGAPLLLLDTVDREIKLKKLDDEIADLEKKAATASKLAKKKGAKPTVLARAKELQMLGDNAKAEREKLKAEAGAAIIKSSATGVVSELKAKAGEKVPAGTIVARIVDPRKLKVVASVDEKAASSLEKGQRLVASLKGRPVELEIESVDGERAVAELANDDRVFAAGDSGAANIKVASRSLLMRLFK